MKTKEQIVSEIKLRNEYKANRDRSDLLKILDMPEGLRYLWKLLTLSGVFQAGLVEHDSLLFAEGKRYIGIQILNEIMEHDPTKFEKMQLMFKADSGIDIKLQKQLQAEEQNDVL